jgi:hypothetical protein
VRREPVDGGEPDELPADRALTNERDRRRLPRRQWRERGAGGPIERARTPVNTMAFDFQRSLIGITPFPHVTARPNCLCEVPRYVYGSPIEKTR